MTLADLGIHLRHPNRAGEHRAACPWCDRGPRDTALAVRLEQDGGATWLCHRCGAKGAIRPEHSDRPGRPAQHRQERRDKPERYYTLAPWARTLWTSCKPILPGTVAATYLGGRGCALPPWPETSDLQWRPNLRHPAGYVGPALVGLVTDVETGEPISLLRTWLQADGTGKAGLDKPRLLLAKHRSDGVVRLWPDEEVTAGLVVGEGVETALAAAAAGLSPVWATISAGNLARFPVLPGLEGLSVLVDHDRPDRRGRRAGIEAAGAVVERNATAGFDADRDIVVIFPPIEGQDTADLVAASA